MLLAAAIAILLVMFLALSRALVSRNTYDRILAVNMFGTKTVLLVAVLAVVLGRADIVDIALVYALVNFISIIAVLRFFEYGERETSSE